MTLEEALQKICSDQVYRLVVSNPRHADDSYIRTEMTLKTGRNAYYQQENRTKTQVFHENFPPENLLPHLVQLLPDHFAQLNAWSETREYSLRLSKKIKCCTGKRCRKELSCFL